MSDVRSPESPTPRIIRPGATLGPKPPPSPHPRTACSALGAFAVCPQLYAFGYEMGLEPLEARNLEARIIGSLIHVGLAYRYGLLMEKRPEWLVYPTPDAPDARHALWICGQDRPELATRALAIFDAYQAWYPEVTWTPILVEHQFEVQIPVDGVIERYTLRIDLLARDNATGELILIDHKSAYKLTKHVGDDYRADREMLTGLALCRANGYDVKSVMINAMSKPMKTQPQPLFQRYPVPISPHAYERLGEDTIYWIRQMREAKKLSPDPTKRPRTLESCVRKYGRCDFYGLCADGPQQIVEFRKKW